ETALGCGDGGIVGWIGQRSAQGISPVVLPSGPVKEVIENAVDLEQFPILTFHEDDGGPYITGGIGISKDPETGRQNAGFYSLQLKGPDRLALRMLPSTHGYEIFQKRLDRGLPTQMAIAIGLHPVEMLAASASTLHDEFALAGGLRGEALELVKCETIDVDVPAHAEIVLEGTILPDTKEPEGPIGDWLGYYPLVEDRHILKIERITHRKDPIYQTVLAGSGDENLLLSLPRSADVLRAARKAVSGVKDVSLDPFLQVCVLQLDKRFEGEPMNAILAAFGEVTFIKVCIAVDSDVDLHNMNDVMWAVVTRTRLEDDLNVIGNVMGFSRDPFGHYKSKLAIDATHPLENAESYRRAKVVNPDLDFDAYLAPGN
ncbi:MAG: UbiD family decarboxylase, partial [Alphaproteobacteria bacterium]|nr:UbiD family decarboxylase [Alphaproteobacteria bacterium]